MPGTLSDVIAARKAAAQAAVPPKTMGTVAVDNGNVIQAIQDLKTVSENQNNGNQGGFDDLLKAMYAMLHFLDGISDKLTYPDANNNQRVSIQNGTLGTVTNVTTVATVTTVTTVTTVATVTNVAKVTNFGNVDSGYAAESLCNTPVSRIYQSISVS